ncbi:hypothetical protein [Vibrio porteresiae]|uniref:Uncharacterized protein n=1 Tax=Vibrio porteresiae DSM 19223 TaxID=1123496 RepID=A0ABZ0QEQ6_9VIBR|nr:hypothetical protein [Vibrio porteresiae]WPC74949.1 hypothetical protein R8Z52_07060 [Vibrio porteresiae DSM 19223]
MTKKNVLFFVLVILFALTAIITLLGVLNFIKIEDFYLKSLFGAFLLELAATIFSLANKSNLLEDTENGKAESQPRYAALRLHVWGDHRAPDRIEAENIFRWYYLQNIIIGINEKGAEVRQNTSNILFLTFDKDVSVSTFKVQSPDIQLPVYEVKDFNQRYAIIVFSGAVNAGTLEVKVVP